MNEESETHAYCIYQWHNSSWAVRAKYGEKKIMETEHKRWNVLSEKKKNEKEDHKKKENEHTNAANAEKYCRYKTILQVIPFFCVASAFHQFDNVSVSSDMTVSNVSVGLVHWYKFKTEIQQSKC